MSDYGLRKKETIKDRAVKAVAARAKKKRRGINQKPKEAHRSKGSYVTQDRDHKMERRGKRTNDDMARLPNTPSYRAPGYPVPA